MQNLLNYKHLRYFWAVAREGNLTRAAQMLNVSQSALSIQIQKLEEHLGQSLFERKGRGLHLTEAGRIALEHAETIFTVGDELIGTLKHNRPGQRPNLKVGAEATLSRNFQMMFLAPLLADNEVNIRLRSGHVGDLLHDLESHRLDVVLTNRPPTGDEDAQWVTQELARQDVAVISRTELGFVAPNLDGLLMRQPLLLPGRGTTVRNRFDAYISQRELSVRIAAEVDDMAMLRLLVLQGNGLAIIPPIVVRHELKSGSLVNHGVLEGLYEAFYAVSIDRRFPNPVLRDLLNAMHA